jgi:hypothetical protein
VKRHRERELRPGQTYGIEAFEHQHHPSSYVDGDSITQDVTMVPPVGARRSTAGVQQPGDGAVDLFVLAFVLAFAVVLENDLSALIDDVFRGRVREASAAAPPKRSAARRGASRPGRWRSKTAVVCVAGYVCTG